jgi:ADP-heptose:LPS heptosyltransferase
LTNTPAKILTINFGGIGDEVLFLPTLEGIRASYPDAEIALLVEPRSAGIGVITDLIDEVVTFDIKKRPLLGSDLIELITLVRRGSYDMVVSSGSSPMVAGLLFLSGIPRRIGYNSNRLAPYLLTEPMPLNRSQYAAKMYHDLIAALPGAAKALPAIPRIRAGSQEKESMESLLAKLWSAAGDAGKARNRQRKRILIHPGTSQLAILKGLNKTWSAENWCKLVELLEKEPGVDVILAGGPDDKEAIEQINAKLKPGSKVISTYGHTRNLKELVGLIDICDLIICVDSAPMHLAVALNKPLVALFGPTNEAVLMPPNVEHFVVLRKETLGREKLNAAPGQMEQAAQQAVAESSSLRQASFLYPGAPAVQLPAEIVFQSALDQLRRVEHQDGSPAVHAD